MLAHELRNPLQVAQIYLDFVHDEEGGATVAEIADAVDRIDEIIEVLLMLARGNDAVDDRESVDLSEVAADAWANTATGRAAIEVAASTRLRANRAHLQQLLENLFRNAVEHGSASDDSPDGPTAERDRPVTVRVGALDDGFYVEDTGAGIPEADREKVAQAGYTTDEGGIGLGLTFVAELADAYGWEYAVTESDEGGARFEVTGVESAPEECRTKVSCARGPTPRP
jgi:signal transduction histidine kinase